MPPGSPWGNSVSRSRTAYSLGATSDMDSGLWHHSQPIHLLPFLQHTGSLVSLKSLPYSRGSSSSVMMRRQAVYHTTTKHSNVWRWWWQFLMWHAQDSSTSFQPRWGAAAGIQYLSTCTLSETSFYLRAIVRIIIVGRINLSTMDYNSRLYCPLVFRTGQFRWLIIQCQKC